MNTPTDDFFLYLSSNRDRNNFQSNSPSSFTNLISPYNLQGKDYEVGLENIIFKRDFLWVKKGELNYSITVIFKIFKKDGSFADEFTIRYTPQIDITGATIREVISKINQDFKMYLYGLELISMNHMIYSH